MKATEENLETSPQAAATSPADTGASAGSPAPGQVDPPHNGVKQSDSPADQGAKQPVSMEEALAGAKLEQPAEEAAGAANDAATETGGSPDPKTEGQTEAKPKADEPGAEQEAADPFHKRPEWAELKTAVGPELWKKARPVLRKVLEAEAIANARVRELQPLRPIVDELRAHTGDEAGFTTMRNIVRAYANDPAAAVPILENMLLDARTRSGLVVTSTDLKGRLEKLEADARAGTIDGTELAARKAELVELESARAAKRQAEGRLTQTETQRRQQAENASAGALASSLNSWEEGIRQRDPDFGNVTDVDDPQHGVSVADRVFDGIRLFRMAKPQSTNEQVLAEVQRVYKLARGSLPQKPLRESRPVTVQGSSITAKPKARTVREAMDNVKLEQPAG